MQYNVSTVNDTTTLYHKKQDCAIPKKKGKRKMTRAEIMNEKQYLDKYDIMNIFGCGVDRALAIIRSIKETTGNPLGLKGKVLITEYEAWKNAVNANI